MARSEGAVGPYLAPVVEVKASWMPGSNTSRPPFTRRGFLRGSVVAAGGIAAIGVAACAPAGTAGWLYTPPKPTSLHPDPTSLGGASASPAASASADAGHSAAATTGAEASPGASASPTVDHDANAKAVVKRFLDGEWQSMGPLGNQPLAPRMDGDTKVFELTVDRIDHRVDALKKPIAALGFNKSWPGPLLRVTEGDKVRAIFTNNLDESTGIHFHGQAVPNAMDGVPHVTQDPILPGGSFSYEFVAKPYGSHMYHSHHNATDQVGRGLLGAFIVDPRDTALRYQVDQEVIWISNDALGGFTINGRGFPATAPIVAKLGDKVLIRFMNEGVMSHPWHLHGMPMRVVARDGWPLGGAEFTCDTLGVDPGSRWDVIVTCDNPGAWAFHCHILPHAEGMEGMFGMVTALIVT
jgi:FtsP/CotA-like multicopper oxidase with cupredoxin domain